MLVEIFSNVVRHSVATVWHCRLTFGANTCQEAGRTVPAFVVVVFVDFLGVREYRPLCGDKLDQIF